MKPVDKEKVKVDEGEAEREGKVEADEALQGSTELETEDLLFREDDLDAIVGRYIASATLKDMFVKTKVPELNEVRQR